jgi:hypothetical protein
MTEIGKQTAVIGECETNAFYLFNFFMSAGLRKIVIVQFRFAN